MTVVAELLDGFEHILWEVFLALFPMAVLVVLAQLFLLKQPLSHLKPVLVGFLLTFAGLSLFLQGVNAGFMPVGQMMGQKLGSLSYNWVLIPIGFVIGFVITFAEPAVRVLNYQVERVSSGTIPQTLMLYTLSVGVAVSVALAMGRVLYGWPLFAFLLPGYILIFIMTLFAKKAFVGIAFDSGGVATGPMTATFVLAMTIGLASAVEGRDPLTEGFGMVAFVAMAPIVSVLVVGLLYRRKEQVYERRLARESVAHRHSGE